MVTTGFALVLLTMSAKVAWKVRSAQQQASNFNIFEKISVITMLLLKALLLVEGDVCCGFSFIFFLWCQKSARRPVDIRWLLHPLSLRCILCRCFVTDHLPVADCRQSGTKWSVEDRTVFEDLPHFQVQIHDGKAPNTSCDGRRLKALREGYTTITASYVQTYPDGHSVQLEASIMVTAYPPLQVSHECEQRDVASANWQFRRTLS